MKAFAASLAIVAANALPAAAAVAEPSGLVGALRASPDEEPAFVLSADGVHVYECRLSGGNPNVAAWFLVTPDATLFEGTRSVGVHKSANLWESSSDRSSVSGVVRSTQGAGAANLPWVLYRAQPLGTSGMFAGVTSIQRVNTVGGLAPAGGCSATNLGAETRVAYKADYYFYKRRGAA